jgi:hypothetical protein
MQTAMCRSACVPGLGLAVWAERKLDRRPMCQESVNAEACKQPGWRLGSMSLLACHDVRPMDLPRATRIAFIRRKSARMAFD